MGDFNSVPEMSLYDRLFQQNIELQTTYASGIMTIHKIAFVKTHWVVHLRFAHCLVQLTLE